MVDGTRMLQRRALAADWAVSDYILAEGELGVTKDTGIIKIGDGSSTWSALDPAFDSQYLPILGTAANAALLNGVSAANFIASADVATAATADKIAKRLSDGKLKAVAGAVSDDVVTYDQLTTSKISRTVTADFTLALTDVGKMIVVNNSAYTPSLLCNIPTNASVAIPIGSYVDIVTSGKGPTTITPAVGVTNTPISIVYGGGSSVRLVKIATNDWRVVNVSFSPPPLLRRIARDLFVLTNNGNVRIPLDGANRPSFPYGNNADTLGTNEQYNSTTSVFQCFCRRSGWYNIKSQMSLYPNTAGHATIELKVNGNESYLGAGANRGGEYDITAAFSGLVPLNVGDYVEVWVLHNGTTSQINDNIVSSSFFEWIWKRPL